ncbi:MAG TPA: hypothetical protein VK661_12560 [Planctomycetota bacterium]|nr:hypothetical protein [Planctomycetota bacterium]
MMKSALLAPALVLALAASAFAQGVSKQDSNTETVKITVSGGFDMDWVYRSKELTEVLGGSGADEGRIESNANVRFDVDLTEKVSVLVNLATVRLNGTYASIGQLGAGGQNVKLWDLAVKMQEVLDPAVTIQLGTQNDFMFDVRGNGSALFFAPGKSGSFATNAGAGSGVGLSGGDLNYNQVAGAVVWYNRDAAHLAVALLPAIQEGGPASNDEAAYAAMLYYDLDSVGKGSRIGVILALDAVADFVPASGGGSTSQVITIGAAASLKGLGGMNNLEAFGEFYIQSGDIGVANGKAGGSAFKLGGHYVFEQEMAPWVEASITVISGDKNLGNNKIDSFLSYENVNDLMIVESNTFGINWNSNLTAFKIMGGASFTSGGGAAKNNIGVSAALGFFTASEKVAVATGNKDALGTELDLKLTWQYSKAVAFDAGLAFLFGSDILEGITVNRDDSTNLFTLGVSGKF